VLLSSIGLGGQTLPLRSSTDGKRLTLEQDRSAKGHSPHFRSKWVLINCLILCLLFVLSSGCKCVHLRQFLKPSRHLHNMSAQTYAKNETIHYDHAWHRCNEYTLKKLNVGFGKPDARQLSSASSPSMASVLPGPSSSLGGTGTQNSKTPTQNKQFTVQMTTKQSPPTKRQQSLNRWWLCGILVVTSDLRSTGCGFESQSCRCHAGNVPRQIVTCVLNSVAKQYNYALVWKPGR